MSFYIFVFHQIDFRGENVLKSALEHRYMIIWIRRYYYLKSWIHYKLFLLWNAQNNAHSFWKSYGKIKCCITRAYTSKTNIWLIHIHASFWRKICFAHFFIFWIKPLIFFNYLLIKWLKWKGKLNSKFKLHAKLQWIWWCMDQHTWNPSPHSVTVPLRNATLFPSQVL